MTREQFERWQDFALRMAENGWERLPRKSREKVRRMVEDFFDGLTDQEIVQIKDWDSEPYPCDMVTLQLDGENPFHLWNERAKYDRWDETWGNRFASCIRAGLDVASAPSAGVVGFTVADLRRMYPDGIPAWVRENFQHPDGSPAELETVSGDTHVWL